MACAQLLPQNPGCVKFVCSLFLLWIVLPQCQDETYSSSKALNVAKKLQFPYKYFDKILEAWDFISWCQLCGIFYKRTSVSINVFLLLVVSLSTMWDKRLFCLLSLRSGIWKTKGEKNDTDRIYSLKTRVAVVWVALYCQPTQHRLYIHQSNSKGVTHNQESKQQLIEAQCVFVTNWLFNKRSLNTGPKVDRKNSFACEVSIGEQSHQ